MHDDTSRREAIKLASAAVAGAGILAMASAPASAAAVEESDDSEFKGKIVGLTLKDPSKSAYLQNARVKVLGERPYLVGSHAKRSDAADFPNLTYWFAVDSIDVITVFNSLEEMKKVFDMGKKQ